MAFRLRGWKALVHDAVSATTSLVGEGHDSVGRTTVRFAAFVPVLAGPVRIANRSRKFATDGVLATVRGVNRAVEAATDLAWDVAAPIEAQGAPVVMRSDAMGTVAWMEDALVGAVNGVMGDHLHRRSNALGMGMSLRAAPGDAETGLPATPGPRVAVWVHGLATTEWSWCLDARRLLGDPAANFGTLLQRDLGFTPVFVRYNTGRHISENGAALSELLDRMIVDAPEIEEIVLIGHSMGGLVARSATHVSDVSPSSSWVRRVTRLVSLGSPHQGAPLERFAHEVARVLHAVDTPGTRIPAAILRARSQGIKDLGHGAIHDAHWAGADQDAERAPPASVRDPFLPGIAYAFLAGSVTEDPEHPLSAFMGDFLVPVESAEGLPGASRPAFTARIGGVLHHEIQVHPVAYEHVRAFCAGHHKPG